MEAIGKLFAVIASFVAYFVASQPHNNINFLTTKKASKILVLYVTLISIQVIYVFFSLFLDHGLLNINLLKLNMVTPVGASNYIASIILPLLVFVYYIDFERKFKIFTILLGIVSLLMIQSKNALFVLVILISAKFIKSYFRKIIKSKPDANLRLPIIL